MKKAFLSVVAIAAVFSVCGRELVGSDFRKHRLEQDAPGTMKTAYAKFELPSDSGVLKLSFKAKVAGLAVGADAWNDARVIVNFKDANGGMVKGEAVNFNADTDWTRREVKYAVPANARVVECMPSLFNCKAGVFEVDELSLDFSDGDGSAAVRKAAKRLPEKPLAPLTDADALCVRGNRLLNAAGKEVWLQGVAVPSMEWMVDGDHVRESFAWAVCDWRANVLRLALKSDFWFGVGEKHNARSDGGEAYRKTVDELVKYANDRGAYVVIDLHEYKAPTPKHAEFWKDCAKRYANRPGVLFDLLNEPHDISWREWRDGGALKDGGGEAVAENAEAKDVTSSIGMQKLVETVRATGAKNVVICGGLDWAYDLSGIVSGYELKDPSGNGIVYSTHVYPWKSNWKKAFLDCAAKHPLFLGEVGCQTEKMPFERELKDPYEWAPDMIGVIQKHRLNWTAWSFHVSASPCVIADWDYRPTACWGSFVRAALRGGRFEANRER